MIPKGVVVTCPACDSFIEADMCSWQMTVGESEERGAGIVIEMMAWASHDCGTKR